jgi:predicted glutamine amidotransferase
MCGLVGYIVTTDKLTPAESEKYARFFRKGLYLDTVRGFDSTGVARINEDFMVGSYKKAMPGYDYLEHNVAQQFMYSDLEQVKCMLGHNRAATQGKVNALNAHPFTHGHITMMHNGTLTSSYGVGSKFDVDSENICYSLSLCDSEQETKDLLEKLDGAYALVWYNSKDKTVNFARNEERPLHWQKTTTGFVYASESWMIHGARSEPFKPELTPASEVKQLPVGDWTIMSLEDGVTRSVPFVPDEGYSWGNYSTSYKGGSSYTSAKIAGVVKDDNVLVQYTSHGISTVNGKKLVTIYGKLVTQSEYDVGNTTVAMTNFTEEDLKLVIGPNGLRIFTATYGGVYNGHGSKKHAYVTDPEPTYTIQDLKDKAIPESDDVLYFMEQGYREETDDGIPFDGEEYYDHNGNIMTKEKMQNLCNDGCAWCSQPISMDTEDFLWEGDYLMHTDCAESYANSYEEE